MTAIEYLYGTESGTTQMLCEDFAEELQGEVLSLENCDPTQLRDDKFYVIVCSTFGVGELPASAEPFYNKLQQTKPDLSGVQFAIFGLGDAAYTDTFGQGSETIMNEMLSCGAKMRGERVVFDVSTGEMPEDAGMPWLRKILAQKAVA